MLPAPAQVKKNLLVSIATRHRRGDFSCYREAVFLADQSDMPHRPLTHGGIAHDPAGTHHIRANLKLRLHQNDSLGVFREKSRKSRNDMPERNERNIDDKKGKLRACDLRIEGAKVLLFQRPDSRIRSQSSGKLPGTKIGRAHV